MGEVLFQEIVVWREENENTFYRYRGFKNLKTEKFYFSYCDHIHRHNYENDSIQKHQEFAFRQQLFAGGLEGLEENEWFDSIEEAIAYLERE
jgi:hypothetical protein